MTSDENQVTKDAAGIQFSSRQEYIARRHEAGGKLFLHEAGRIMFFDLAF